MQAILARGLAAVAASWPDLRTAYGWVHRATHLLNNEAGLTLFDLRRSYRSLLREMSRQRTHLATLGPAVSHFLKVTRSYWLGLFAHCRIPDLPRTNNALEQYFGSARYHERRTSGRKVASPTLVVRGSVRVVAAIATRQRPFTPEQLCPVGLDAWRTLRKDLRQRQERRCAQSRFRKNPDAYLAQIEARLLQQTLPP